MADRSTIIETDVSELHNNLDKGFLEEEYSKYDS